MVYFDDFPIVYMLKSKAFLLQIYLYFSVLHAKIEFSRLFGSVFQQI